MKKLSQLMISLEELGAYLGLDADHKIIDVHQGRVERLHGVVTLTIEGPKGAQCVPLALPPSDVLGKFQSSQGHQA